jgi:two-component system, sensor histidine kinase and response regulator
MEPKSPMAGDLPHKLPGINIETALKRLAGNKQLLTKLLLNFTDNYAGIAEDIRKALMDGDIDLAQRLTHNLKGISGNLSADEVFTASQDLERSIKKDGKEGQTGACLAKLEKALKKVMKAAKTIPLEDNVREKAIAPQEETLPDLEKIGPILKEMYHLLDKNSLTARKTFVVLKEQFNGGESAKLFLEQLEDALNRMDFKSARKYVMSVASMLGINL